MAIPADIILLWDGTEASIPAGWSRESALDNKFLRSVNGGNPGTTGGSATHTHTPALHTHLQEAHSHGIASDTAGRDANNNNVADGGSGFGAHAHNLTFDPTEAGNNQNAAGMTVSSDNGDPIYHKFIAIKSAGTHDAPPLAVCMGFKVAISGFTKCNGGSLNMVDKFLRISNAGEAGGLEGGGSHLHSLGAHTHVQLGHTHQPTQGGIYSGGGTGGVAFSSSGHAPPGVNSTHVHPTWTAGADTVATNQDATAVVNSETILPPYSYVNFLQNTSGLDKYSNGMIGIWTGLLANIPADWYICDGTRGTYDLSGNFLTMPLTDLNVGVAGGSVTHSHSTVAHNHTQDAHTNTGFSGGADYGTKYVLGTKTRYWSSINHAHTATSEPISAVNYPETFDLVAPATALPPYYEVAFIQYQTSEPPPPTPENVPITLIWTGLEADIPADWARDDLYAGRFIKGVVNSGAIPGEAGGSATHIHVMASHTHILSSHSHFVDTDTVTPALLSLSDNNAFGINHSHVQNSVAVATPTNSYTTPTLNGGDNKPPYYDVIFITATGIPDVPPEAIAFSAGYAPFSGWHLCDGTNGTPDLVGAFVRGANVGSEAGGIGTGGHNHVSPAHTHTQSTHTHTGETGGASWSAALTGSSGGGGIALTPDNHSHGIAPTSEVAINDSTSISINTAINDPPWTKLTYQKNDNVAVSLPVGLIAIWGGLISDLPSNWRLCDGSYGTPNLLNTFVKGTASSDVLTIGGFSGHAHTSAVHTHTVQAHTHGGYTNSVLNAVEANRDAGGGNYVAQVNHAHAITLSSNTIPNGNSTVTTGSTNTEPEYVTVAFVMYLGNAPTPSGPDTDDPNNQCGYALL